MLGTDEAAKVHIAAGVVATLSGRSGWDRVWL
jgi:hypothetical protein